MDHQGSARHFRSILPRTAPPGHPGGSGQLPAPEDGKMKRASTACKECQHRRTRCDGDYLTGKPCTQCTTHGRTCVFDESSDKRRKEYARRTEDQAEYYRDYVERLLQVIREGDESTIQQLIGIIREEGDQEIQTMLAHCLNQDPPPAVMENEAMRDFTNPR